MQNNMQIFGLIQKAMQKIGAIGKSSVNKQQNYSFRGIDAVYNALNPVMSELGLFVCPEILDHKREERETVSEYNGNTKKSILKYSILTIKYTVYAPDGSNISCVVVGEGMDSGDKASNKAMSVALKYAMFQLFMIPTEEMIDPDLESHVVTSGAKKPTEPKKAQQTKQESVRQDAPATVEKAATLPQEAPANPVLDYMGKEREALRKARGIDKAENNAIWTKQVEILRINGFIPDKALSTYTQKEAEQMVALMYTKFAPKGVELKADDGNVA